MAWGYPTRTGTDSTIAWYSEIEFTKPYGTCKHMEDSYPAGNAIGHYTQVVWQSSTKLGCGKGKATVKTNRGDTEGDYWVCQYGPAGNYQGQFSAKVLAPSKSVDTCGGVANDVPKVHRSTGGVPGGDTPAPTPAPRGSTGCAAPADHSRGQCETCLVQAHCPEGYYCCPYMKKCVDSGTMPCYQPIANFGSMCYDSSCTNEGCDCPACTNVGQGKDYDWLTWANLENSAGPGEPQKKDCPTPAPGTPAPGTPGVADASSAVGKMLVLISLFVQGLM